MSWTNEGYVKRSDLRLRTTYPFLRTRIFEISPHRYVIYFDAETMDAAAISEEFSYSIGFATANVALTNSIPSQTIRELSVIDDASISAKYEGMPFTRFDLFNIIMSKFPDFDLVEITDVQDGVNYIVAKSSPTASCMEAVEAFCAGLASGNFQVRIDAQAELKNLGPPRDQLQVVSAKLRPQAPTFVRRDEEYWFDNIDRIYSGHLRPHATPDLKSSGLSCFIDFTMGDSQPSLRQALLMYDTVFITPPISESYGGWAAQKFRDDDLLSLLESGRIRLLLAQPEERCDTRFLEAAYERNPASVIGRRASSAILLGDLVQTAREYKLNNSDLYTEMLLVCDLLSESLQVPRNEAIEFLMWPQIAVRKRLDFLMDRGVMGAAAIGPGALFGKQLHRVTNKDLELEALFLGQQAHVAHALNATYLPPADHSEGWNWIVKQVGDRLNYYRSFNNRIVAAWTGNERRKEEKRFIMPSVPIFEFDRDVTLAEIDGAVKLASTRRKGRALIGRLIELGQEEREAEISELSRQLRDLKAKSVGLFSFESLEDAGPLLEALGAYTAPPLFAAKNLLGRLVRAGRRSAKIDNIIDTIEHDLSTPYKTSEDLDFLSKIDRVASLKRDKVT